MVPGTHWFLRWQSPLKVHPGASDVMSDTLKGDLGSEFKTFDSGNLTVKNTLMTFFSHL